MTDNSTEKRHSTGLQGSAGLGLSFFLELQSNSSLAEQYLKNRMRAVEGSFILTYILLSIYQHVNVGFSWLWRHLKRTFFIYDVMSP